MAYELIKLKQLLLTWNYKLVNHSKDPVKTKEIQGNIDQITQEIEAIEALIKSQKKSSGLETITLKLPLEKKNTGTTVRTQVFIQALPKTQTSRSSRPCRSATTTSYRWQVEY